MSQASIYRAANDTDLSARVLASAHQEANASEELANTIFGKGLLSGNQNIQALMWQVAIDTEAAYETAVQAGRGAPGHDQDIITDAQITAAVVAGWPPDPEVV